jgi:hypothetical protein
MGRASSRKKVQRAARAAGGGARGKGRSVVWPLSLAGMILLGVSLVAVSRGGSAAGEAPRLGDHWHEAYGVYVCDAYLPPFPDNMAAVGLHTHADGLIHIEPRSTRETGVNATVGRFADGVGLEVTEESMELPDGTTYRDGDQCGGDPAEVRILRDGQVVDGDPDELRLRDGGTLAFVFAPTNADIPPVPAAVDQEKPATSRG